MPRNKLSPLDREIRQNISDNLKALIKSRGMTQTDLSDKAGIKYSTLSGYFNRTSTPNAGSVQKIADALGVFKSDIDPRFKSEMPRNLFQPTGIRRIPVLGIDNTIISMVKAGTGQQLDNNNLKLKPAG